MLYQKMQLGIAINVCVNLFCMPLGIIYISMLHIYLFYLSIDLKKLAFWKIKHKAVFNSAFLEVHCIASSRMCKLMNLQGL